MSSALSPTVYVHKMLCHMGVALTTYLIDELEHPIAQWQTWAKEKTTTYIRINLKTAV